MNVQVTMINVRDKSFETLEVDELKFASAESNF
jgi:hypothetical protein